MCGVQVLGFGILIDECPECFGAYVMYTRVSLPCLYHIRHPHIQYMLPPVYGSPFSSFEAKTIENMGVCNEAKAMCMCTCHMGKGGARPGSDTFAFSPPCLPMCLVDHVPLQPLKEETSYMLPKNKMVDPWGAVGRDTIYIYIYIYMYIYIYIYMLLVHVGTSKTHTYIHTDRPTDKQTDRQTDRQTNKQNRQTST